MKKCFCVLMSLIFCFTVACGHDSAHKADVSCMENVSVKETVSILETVSFETVYQNAEIVDVPALCQYPDLPTGCESASAAMVLQFLGEEITPAAFAAEWLECSEDFYTYNGVSYGPHPNEVFAGNPFSEYAYGCFSKPIANAVNNNSRRCEAKVIKGKSLTELCEEYISEGDPLLIWATISMKPSYEGASWVTPNGEEFVWPACEHCLVLVGYDNSFYYFNDPQNGATVAFEKELSERRFAELGSQAVYIFKK